MKKFLLILLAVIVTSLQGMAAFYLARNNPCYLFQKGRKALAEKNYLKALGLLKRASEKGNQDAQLLLPECYYDFGSYYADLENYTQARSFWEKAARKNHAGAMVALADFLARQEDAEQQDQARELYRQAAEKGNEEGRRKWLSYESVRISLGKTAYGQQKYPEAYEHFQKAYELGNIEASYYLGLCLESGLGVEKNVARAIEFYREGAEKKYDLAEKKWLSFGSVQFNLGKKALADGRYDDALEHFQQAARKKVADSGEFLSKIWMEIALREWRKKNFEKAFQAFCQADNSGNPQAAFYLGECYEKGLGCTQNRKKAMASYLKASRNGSQKASDCWIRMLREKK